MPVVISMSGSSGHLKSQQGHSAQDQNPGTTNQNARLLWMLVGKWCGPTCPSRQGIWQINKNVWQLLQGHAAAEQPKTPTLQTEIIDYCCCYWALQPLQGHAAAAQLKTPKLPTQTINGCCCYLACGRLGNDAGRYLNVRLVEDLSTPTKEYCNCCGGIGFLAWDST